MEANHLARANSEITSITRNYLRKVSQEQVVLFVTIVFFVLFSICIRTFATMGNIMLLLRNVCVLGIFSVGMGIVVIGRGIDLSQVATGAVSTAWAVHLMQRGDGILHAILIGLVVVILMGLINGYLVAFIEIPPLFVTIASGICVYGFVRHFMLHLHTQHWVPETAEAFLFLGQGKIFGVPMPIVCFASIAFLVHLFLSRTDYGRFTYAQGDNEEAGRLTGIPIRPAKILQYTLCSIIGYVAALVMASSTAGLNVTIASSSLIFDVVLVVVLGGISLIGGRGSMLSIVVGAVLVGTLLNGMVLIDLGINYQDLAKSIILLGAIVFDTILHPRDEETARQGDI